MRRRENVNDTNQVVIVDLADANNVIRRPSNFSPSPSRVCADVLVTADSAIMHPKEKIIALKGQFEGTFEVVELRDKVRKLD
jgi:clathrin heavy chain